MKGRAHGRCIPVGRLESEVTGSATSQHREQLFRERRRRHLVAIAEGVRYTHATVLPLLPPFTSLYHCSTTTAKLPLLALRYCTSMWLGHSTR